MDTSKWKWFRYDEIFVISTYREGNNILNSERGCIPYVGASCFNNGVTNYVQTDNVIAGNKITVARNGSVGCAFYQSRDFVVSPDDIRIFELKNHALNKYLAVFLCCLIEKEKYRYAYGRKFGTGRMNAQTIKLPAAKDGSPDWAWMGKYVKNVLVPKLPKKARAVWTDCFDPVPMSLHKIQHNVQKWKWFRLGDWFDKPYKAKAYNAIDLTIVSRDSQDSIAYITRTDLNNGCKSYVQNENFEYVENGNAITIGDTTATIFYQEREFICGDHMVVLRSGHLNKYVGLFVTTLLNKERFRYNYGRAFNKDVVANTLLKLPARKIAENKYEPDWQFMEDYIKSLPYSSCL